MRLYYQLLNSFEQSIYNKILERILEYHNRIAFGSVNLSSVKRVLKAVLYDYPQIFYVKSNGVFIEQSAGSVIIHLDYDYSIQEVTDIQNKINNKVNRIVTQAMFFEDQFTKELFVYNYLVNHIEYNHGAKISNDFNVTGPLLANKGVCLGIAKTFKLIMDKLGIGCMIAVGNVKHDNGTYTPHAWNIIAIDRQLYHLDATMDLNETQNLTLYRYFNVTSQDIALDRDITTAYPVCNSCDYNYYHYNNCFIDNSVDLNEYIKQKISNREHNFSFRCSFKVDIEQLKKFISGCMLLNLMFGRLQLVCYKKLNIYSVRIE